VLAKPAHKAKGTSKQVASEAGAILANKDSTKKEKSVAAAALREANSRKPPSPARTSKPVATKASAELRDKKEPLAERSVAGGALSERKRVSRARSKR
jgi:hypothetical protein